MTNITITNELELAGFYTAFGVSRTYPTDYTVFQTPQDAQKYFNTDKICTADEEFQDWDWSTARTFTLR